MEEDPGTHFARSAYLFGRLLGVVFLIAFVSFHVQLEGLVGDHGIEPARELFAALDANGLGFWQVPTLGYWLSLHTICALGELASIALIAGAFSGPTSLLAAFFYLSIVNAGGAFMAFQWDSLLVETGLAASLVLPWWPFEHPARAIEPPRLGRWVIYLLLFRLMFLSGVVKLASGDEAWRSLRALDYHYWTQPLPGPLAWFVHQLPAPIQRVSTFLVFVLEIGAPFAMFVTRYGKRSACAALVALMLVIAATGNYGFFNLLAIALCLPLLDDRAIEVILRKKLAGKIVRAEPSPLRKRLRWIAAPAIAALLALGPLAIVVNLGGAAPDLAVDALERAGRFRAVNGYGLFAVMTRVRREIRIEGSLDGREWREYRFAYKPGDPTEIPGWSAPHMPRLDWQMWFAALGGWRNSPWLVRFMHRLREGRPEVLGLLEDDPFDGRRPTYVRAILYDYQFGDTSLLWNEGKWWEIERFGPYAPVVR